MSSRKLGVGSIIIEASDGSVFYNIYLLVLPEYDEILRHQAMLSWFIPASAVPLQQP